MRSFLKKVQDAVILAVFLICLLLRLLLQLQRSYQPWGCYQRRLSPSFQREPERKKNLQTEHQSENLDFIKVFEGFISVQNLLLDPSYLCIYTHIIALSFPFVKPYFESILLQLFSIFPIEK